MVGKRFPVLRVVGSKFEMLALLTSAETGAVGICGKRFRPKFEQNQIAFVKLPRNSENSADSNANKYVKFQMQKS